MSVDMQELSAKVNLIERENKTLLDSFNIFSHEFSELKVTTAKSATLMKTESEKNSRHNSEIKTAMKVIVDEIKGLNKVLYIDSGIDNSGVVPKVKEHDEYISKKKESTAGWQDWVFRLIVTTILGFIMAGVY